MGSTFYCKRIPTRNPERRPRSRPKTFKTKEAAEKYATEHKIAKYEVEKLSNHKFRIKIL
ncbi:hypothetical protein ACFLZN_02235 [Nanoarchaeota archaeon]